MEIGELKQIIDRIAADNRFDPDDLVAELAEIVKLKYGSSLMEKERVIIDEVRNKILTRLYNTHEHRIDKRESDEIRHYRLDSLEAKYLDAALEELVTEGLAQSDSNETSLTDAGILKYKEFYGEI